MDFKLILDVIVALLLAATIAYAVMLNQRLSALRKNRDELAKLIISFNEATVRAESSIPKLRKAADEAGQALIERVEKAQTLRDDLAFMIERGDAMATRLENAVRSGRGEAGKAGGPSGSVGSVGSVPSSSPAPQAGRGRSAATYGDEDFEDDRSEAERELLRALQSAR